jgi:phage-related protein
MHDFNIRPVVLIGAVCFLFVGAAFAQHVSHEELMSFDQFLDSHPAIAKDLQTNPLRVNDAAYLSAHPDLKEFLASHHAVRQDIEEHPKNFMNREKAFERAGKDISRVELRNLDDFLDKHPAIEKDLQKDPSLVNNADYLAKHPDLGDFLKNHGHLGQDLRSNPKVVIREERKFDKDESAIDKREHQQEKAEHHEENSVRHEPKATKPSGKH